MKYLKVLGFVLTIIVFYYFIIVYGIGALSVAFDRSTLIGWLLVVLFIIALALWSKISCHLMKEMKVLLRK